MPITVGYIRKQFRLYLTKISGPNKLQACTNCRRSTQPRKEVEVGSTGERTNADIRERKLTLFNATENYMGMLDKFKESMMVEFDMSDLGTMLYFLRIEVIQSTVGTFMSQKKYVQEILDRFQMKNCNSVSTLVESGLKRIKEPEGRSVDNTLYKQIMGSLMYLTAARPDIQLVASLISRYMENPKEMHLPAVKMILRYLQGTSDFDLSYNKGQKSELIGYTDNDYAGDCDDRKSTSGYVFMMGSTAISWSSRKQSIVTLSTTEVEYVAATSCTCQAVWLRNVLAEIHFNQQGATTIYFLRDLTKMKSSTLSIVRVKNK